MIEHNYAITIVLEYVDDELLYKATADKFPDMVHYGSEPMHAYRGAIATIRDLIAMGKDMGHPIPEPDYVSRMMQ